MKHILPPNMESMILPRINISPFSYQSLDILSSKLKSLNEYKNDLYDFLGKDYILTESGRHAIELVLSELRLLKSDVITIFPSLGTNYVSGCVTKSIEKYCKWSMKIEKNTKATFVIHEWGIPHPGIDDICNLGFPVIEDCAYSFASTDYNGLTGNRSMYSIYSLPKFFEINFGGIVSGLSHHNNILSSAYIDYIYSFIGSQLQNIQKIISKRIENWNILKKLFSSIGTHPFFELKEGIVPGVFMFSTNLNLEHIKAKYHAYGVESTIYYGSNAFYIPCNQSLTENTLTYMFSIYKSMLQISKENAVDKIR